MTKHSSTYSASYSPVWMNCSAAVSSYSDLPDSPSIASVTGDVAHHLGELCLRLGVNVAVFEGWVVSDVKVTRDMVTNVQLYVSKIRGLSREHGSPPLIEHRVTISSISDDMYGTADAIFVSSDTVEVVDYKNGRVPVGDSWQLRFYGVATLDTFSLWDKVGKVVLTVVQPNYPHKDGPIRSITYSMEEMRKFRSDFSCVFNSPIVFNTGPHCEFCKIRGGCEKRRELTYKLASIGANSPGEMTHDELIAIHKEIPAMRSYLKRIEEMVNEIAKKGGEVPGYKVVKSYPRGKCVNEEGLVSLAKKRGVREKELYNINIRTKSVVARLFPDDDIGEYYTSPSFNLSLVPMVDRRPSASVIKKFPPIFHKQDK